MCPTQLDTIVSMAHLFKIGLKSYLLEARGGKESLNMALYN